MLAEEELSLSLQSVDESLGVAAPFEEQALHQGQPEVVLSHAGQMLYFRVTLAERSIKQAVRKKAHGEESLKNKAVVAVHPTLGVDRRDRSVCISVTQLSVDSTCGAPSSSLCFSPLVLPLTALTKLCSWEIKEDLMHLFPHALVKDLTQEQQDLLPDLLRTLTQNAAGIGEGLTARGIVLAKLETQGLVAGPPWSLTTAGRESLLIGHKVFAPKRVLRNADVEDLASASKWQLFGHLQRQGWQHSLVEGVEFKRAKATMYVSDSPERFKKFYSRTGDSTISHAYLLCLCMAASHKKPIPHFKTDREYLEIMGREATESRPMTRARMRKMIDRRLIVGETEWPEDALPDRPVRQRAPRRRREPPAGEGAGEEEHDVDGSSNDGSLSTSTGQEANGGESDGSSSSGSSRSSSGSSASSPTQSNEEPPPLPPPCLAPQPQSPQGSAAASSRGGRRTDVADLWGFQTHPKGLGSHRLHTIDLHASPSPG